MASADKGEIEDIKEYHTNNRVHFNIKPADFKKFVSGDLDKKLKLQTSLQLTNMVLFNHKGKLKKYASTKEILNEFFDLRISFYDKRKNYLISRLRRDLEILSNKCRFIRAVIDEEIKVRNVKKLDICQQLFLKKFVQMKDMPKILSTKQIEKKPKVVNDDQEENAENAENDDMIETEDLTKEYNYLLSMSIWSLSYEKVEQLKKEVTRKEEELNVVNKTTLEMMWINDLDQFLMVLDEVEEEEEKMRVNRPKVKGNGGKKARAKPKKKVDEEKEGEETEKPKKKPAAKAKKEEKKSSDEAKVKKEEKTSSDGKDQKDKPIIKKEEKQVSSKQMTLNFSRKTIKEEEKKENPSTKIPNLQERLEAKLTSQQTSTSFIQGYENFSQKNEENDNGKRKATSHLDGKAVSRKKFVDSEDELSFLERDKENEESGNKEPVVLRNKGKKNYVESEDEDSKSGSVFAVD